MRQYTHWWFVNGKLGLEILKTGTRTTPSLFAYMVVGPPFGVLALDLELKRNDWEN